MIIWFMSICLNNNFLCTGDVLVYAHSKLNINNCFIANTTIYFGTLKSFFRLIFMVK